MAQDPRAILQKAEKMAQSASRGFSFFGGHEDKHQAAADLFVEAGNAFRIQKLEREAGQAFERAAEIQTHELKELDDAANTLVDAFKAYRKVDPEAAVRCLDMAINRYCVKGNFRRAASHKETEGELFEVELGDTGRALKCYETAAGWYESDTATALANKLWIKVADLAALGGDYHKAIELYEKVAQVSINNSLMRYSVKEYFLRAGICHLATGDNVGVQRALEKYRDMDPSFERQREYALLVDLSQAIQDNNQEEFTDKFSAYDKVSRLDKWKTDILVMIRNSIQAVEAEEEFV